MFPNSNKIEIFARNERLGWDSFGDEITLFYHKATNGKIFVIEDDEVSGTLEIYEEKK